MKWKVFAWACFSATAVFAQTALTPPTPALTPGTTAINPAIPVSPALTPPTNGLAIPFPGSTVATPTPTPITVNDVAPVLTNLEAVLVQSLPALTAFNDEFGYVNLLPGGQQPLNPAVGSLPAARTAPGSGTGTLTSTRPVLVGTNAFALPPGLAGLGTTNGSGNLILTGETLRALVVLQNDIERMLPVLDAINGGTNFTSAALPSGTVTGSSTNSTGP